ncbi:3-carboxy-cis,cis-muconate cycloisomerase [Kibdelosporangium banguiense]|uniref:3-carboxy-cis,cis-muconate cycloisomerase n=1 Tax=Kibdelosporangium banguiense TaxID=1365924 RepID=A0ABS4U0H8_9PSEU|nr:adenylosuccinate lyase family protein [Kibdelosporangium banguiense]MBP2329690.1 3-carboxy-cis,cis-muconate cycloisomerase [Kibdelosporangium banguiense]
MTLDTGLLSPVRAGVPVETLTSDEAWLRAMCAAEAGLARAQAKLGTVPAGAAEMITKVAGAESFDLADLAVRSRGAANPVVVVVQELTARVAAIDPAAAQYVHRGSTSQDILDTAACLVAARVLELVRANLAELTDALAELADRHRLTAMPGRTLTQHAVPTTFGLKAAGWLHLVRQVDDRAAHLLSSLPVQIGGAAGTMAAYLEHAALHGDGVLPDDYAANLITAYAQEMGLCEPVVPWHALRTPFLDVAGWCALLTGALGKIAVDVQSLCRTEVAELGEPAAAGRGVSSAMPQKQNPALATMIRAAALQVPGLVATLAHCMLAEDERSGGTWHAEWQPLRECLRLAGAATHTATELITGLRVHPDRMRANLAITNGTIVAERLSAHLTPHLGKDEAKRVVSAAASRVTEGGTTLAENLAQEPSVAALFDIDMLKRLLDPDGYLGAADHLVERALISRVAPSSNTGGTQIR